MINDLQVFWDFVKISKDCGAFDEESFAHFREVYYEDFEQLIQYNPPYQFILSKIVVENALNHQREILKRENYPESTLDLFDNPNFYIDFFIEVTAFRHYLIHVIKEKLKMTFNP
jgi:hypothetical protein